MPLWTSKYVSHFTEYKHNKELTQRLHIDARIWNFNQNYLVIVPKIHSLELIVCLQIVVQMYR